MNGGISVLRCLLMYLIVLHHTICHTALADSALLLPLFLLTVPAVDGFLVISGWFGMRFSWRKCGVIAGQIAYYAALSSAFSVLAAKMGWISHPILAVGNAWYGVAYLALLLVVPILNAGIEALVVSGRWRVALGALVALLVGDYLSRAIGLGFSVSGFGSHTFATFLLVYCIVRMVRSAGIGMRRFEGLCVLAFVVFEAIFVMKRMAGADVDCVAVLGEWGFYNCPLVVAAAIGAVAFASRMRIPEWLARIAAFLSPSMFAVYLIHDASPVGKQLLLREPIAHLNACLVSISWSLVVFVICVVIDLIFRRWPMRMFCRRES